MKKRLEEELRDVKHEIENIHKENNRLKDDLNIQKSHNVEIEKIFFEKSRIEQSLEEEVSVLKHMDQANKKVLNL